MSLLSAYSLLSISPLYCGLNIAGAQISMDIRYNSASLSDGRTLTVVEGTELTIKCRSNGTRVPSTITWYLDNVLSDSLNGEYLPNPRDSRLLDTESSLVIRPYSGNQTLRCRAKVLWVSVDKSILLEADGKDSPNRHIYTHFQQNNQNNSKKINDM